MSYEPRRDFIKSKLFDKLNEQIAHLTADRTAEGSEQLGPTQWAEIKDAIENEISRFEKALTSDYKPTWKPAKDTIVMAAGTPSATNVISVIK